MSNNWVCVDSTSDGIANVCCEAESYDGTRVVAGDMATICCNDCCSCVGWLRACNGDRRMAIEACDDGVSISCCVGCMRGVLAAALVEHVVEYSDSGHVAMLHWV